MSSWVPAASILKPHFAMGAAMVGTLFTGDLRLSLQLYVVGGSGDSGDVEAQVNPFRRIVGPPPPPWAEVASLLTPRFGHAVSVGTDNEAVSRIYAIGGRDNPGGTLLNGVEAYTPFPKPGWAAVAPMPTSRERAAAASAPDPDGSTTSLVYVAGGSNGSSPDNSSPLNTLETYNPSTNKWKDLAHMHIARDGAAAVTGTDGRIYVIGGIGTSGSVEAYDPATNSWENVTPLNTPRDGPRAVLGPDGQIYAIGGENGAEVLATVEVYNFGSRIWTPGPSMSAARVSLAAAVGPDGGIYAIGGDTGLLGPTDSVEVLFV